MDTLTRPNGAHPHLAPVWIYRPRFEWVAYPASPEEATEHDRPFGDPGWRPEPGYAGFAVKLLANPTHGDVRDEQLARTKPDDEYLPLVAPRVAAWNALAAGADGEPVPIPAPGEHPDNWQAFYAIETELTRWVLRRVQRAHLPNPPTRPSTLAAPSASAPAGESAPPTLPA